MRIAIFDYKITPTNPIGGCHLQMLKGLAQDHDFTVFAVEFENPDPEHIEWIRIPAPTRPLILLFLCFHVLAPLYFWGYCLRRHVKFDQVQSVETNLSFGSIAYSQFCHRAYLQTHWSETQPQDWIRRSLRWLDHASHAALEAWTYRRVQHVITPSKGLAQELQQTYPWVAEKIQVIYNPVDTQRLICPKAFDQEAYRASMGLDPDIVTLVFVALGQFERKGLPIVLEALTHVSATPVQLIVVGGEADLVTDYQVRTQEMGLSDQVKFVGMQRDIRPYLWASDGFVFPSSYETFSLVSFEAAAAGLPLLVSHLHGVEDLLVDGNNGFLLSPRTVEQVYDQLDRFLQLSESQRQVMGQQAQQSAQAFDLPQFLNGFRSFYQQLEHHHHAYAKV